MHVFFCDETKTEKINGGSLYMQPHRLLSLSIFPFTKPAIAPREGSLSSLGKAFATVHQRLQSC